MSDEEVNLLERLYREERKRVCNASPSLLPQPQTIHYTQLPEDRSDGPIAKEWNVYRREASRLLAAGHENKWVLIKGEEIIGIWDNEDEADQVRLQRFFMQPVLLKQICVWERLVRGGGLHRRWPS